MCGIAGILSFSGEKVDTASLRKMTDAIQHRGPDGEGHWLNSESNIGFGHRRLSIIDLSSNASQPMHYADGRFTITFNGEIYNYIELKLQLIKEGYKFHSESDTEVLLALYMQKGPECLNELDGMFSFAIWDEQKQELFCARDRFGEKPFHYYKDSGKFIFASEIKQFWPIGIKKIINQKRLQDFISLGHTDDYQNMENSFYDSIKRLDAASYIIISHNGSITKKKYWAIENTTPTFSGNLEEAKREFLSLFTDSIRIRLRSDVPVGSSLSGGLDSSSIVMLIDRLKGNELKQNTFSARFKNFSKDEGKHIEEVVKACKNIEVHYTWPDEDYFLNAFDRVVYHQDEPFGSASIVAQWSVMELAKKNNVTVLMDGQGADEQLAGYLPYYTRYLDQLFYNDKKKYFQEYPAYNKILGQASPHIPLYKRETPRMKVGRYKRILLNQSMPIGSDDLQKKLISDTTGEGLKILLRYADRNSMAHSREVRLPFLSHKLVEFVFSLPDEFKLHMGWTKYILRRSMEEILPPSICWRKDKIGYEPPQENWLNTPEIQLQIQKSSQFFNIPTEENSKVSYVNSKNWRLLLAHKYA